MHSAVATNNAGRPLSRRLRSYLNHNFFHVFLSYCAGTLSLMPQATALLLMEQYESAQTDLEALNLYLAQANWRTPEQLQILSNLKTRYERLTDEILLAISAFSVGRFC